MRQIGGEGIVSKRSGSVYRGGESRDWVKVKVFDIGQFVITGFSELGEGRLEGVYVAEARDGALVPAGTGSRPSSWCKSGWSLRWPSVRPPWVEVSPDRRRSAVV